MAGAALLLGANSYGTLAATRALSRAGLEVAIADENRLGRALQSRHVDRKLVHPPLSSPGAVIDWLVEWGTRHPGALLYPSNDHLAWLYAVERERLSKVFVMLSPGEDTIITLLDKMRLHKACEAVGIAVPETRDTACKTDGGTDDKMQQFPALVKPRTHICQLRGSKGLIAHDHHQLRVALERFSEIVSYARPFVERYPNISQPLVQQYLTAGQTDIISISGYADADGVVAARSAVKVLQQPRRAGNGICFEDRPVDITLVEHLSSLCKLVGYYGVFEAEFVPHGNRSLLIDFNPRFYSQMGFDMARGLPLPLVIWHAANKDEAALARVLDRASAWKSRGNEAYCHKTIFDLMLALQGRSGQMTKAEVSRWRTWYVTHQPTDAVRDPIDRMPAVVDAAQLAGDFIRYPNSFLRDYVLNR
jgi:D-aspartate ligase